MSYYRASRATVILCVAAFALCGCGAGEARLADLERSVQDLQARQVRLEDENKSLRADLAARVAVEEHPEIKQEIAALADAAKPAGGEGTAAGPKATAKRAPPTPPRPSESGEAGRDVEKPTPSKAKGPALYDEALRIYLAGKALAAREKFQEFMAEQPESPLIPNAIYWTGETWYHEKDYPQAILNFQEVVSRFPGHHKAADSLLKIGLSYERLGDSANAALYYQALVDDYPSASGAAQARARLKALR